jgi:hypothetical protein
MHNSKECVSNMFVDLLHFDSFLVNVTHFVFIARSCISLMYSYF